MQSPMRAESLLVFVGSLAVLGAASRYLIAHLSLSGDEPWYLLQGYTLVHFHTVDMAQVIHDARLYQQFVRGVPADWVPDFRGNDVLVAVYLPGYAAIVGSLYMLAAGG